MLLARVDTPIEERYLEHGGILAFVLRKLIHSSQAAHV
jgi:aconitase A